MKNINRNVSHRTNLFQCESLFDKIPRLLHKCFEHYLTFKMADNFAWLLQIASCNEMPAHKSGTHVPFIVSHFLQIPMQNCLVFRLNVWELICGLRCNYSNHRHRTDESHWSQNWAGHSHWLTCSTFIDNWYLYIGIHKCRKRSFDLAHLHLYH